MKKQGNAGFTKATTRVKVLALTLTAAVGIYLAMQYVKKEGMPQITWRKADSSEAEPEGVIEPESETRLALPNHPRAQLAPTVEAAEDPFVLLFSTNKQRRVASGNGYSDPPVIRSDKSKQQKVQIPPNALWSTNSVKKGPGVKIAFP